MVSNSALREDVLAELRADPGVQPSDIEVHVHHGRVHLRGTVPTLPQKLQAERDAWRVRGVTDVVDELGVELADEHSRPDAELAAAAREVLRHHVSIPADSITVTSHHGTLTVHGTVDHDYQRRAAVAALRSLWGVGDLVDRITLRPVTNPVDLLEHIRAALLRNALLDHATITAQVDGDTVILTGNVGSRAERVEAERVAWSTPGVVEVRDHLTIR